MSIQEGLEGSHGRDRVQWVPRFNVIEGPHQKLFFQSTIFFQNSASKMANWITVDIVI